MKRRREWIAVSMAVMLLVGGGCSESNGRWKKISLKRPLRDDEKIAVPPDILNTIAEKCTLVSSADAPISAWGVAVGLDDKGSSEVPPELKSDLTKYLKSQIKISDAIVDTEGVTVQEFLEDRDTAVVWAESVIPPGAPRGTKVDVLVSAPPRTQTTSLEGGLLLPIDLRWEQGAGGMRKRFLKPLGKAEGSIFVNPFLDPNKPSDRMRLRRGRILGGLTVLEDMPLRLQLREPDYLMCNVLQKRINERFPVRGRQKVAQAKSRYYIEIHIPPDFREDYHHFLDLLMHLPRSSGPGEFEEQAARVAEAMEVPDASHDSLATVWEAMGRAVLPVVQKMYASKNPEVAYYAARTGLRLGDRGLAGPILVRIAQISGDPRQLRAITELGRHPDVHEAMQPLRDLLNDRNELVRIAAYESLVQRGDFSCIQRHAIDRGAFQEELPAFTVDVVDSQGEFVIYALRTGTPRIVLFGKNMPMAGSIFFNDPTETVTIFSKTALPQEEVQKIRQADPSLGEDVLRGDHVVVFRKLSGSEEISKKFRIPFKVWPLIRVLGSRPRPDAETGMVPGLGLSYSQVVGVLSRLCKENSIRAKFVLQTLPELQRIYQLTPSEGRPDTEDH
ncbi:MAG: flagellar basal body P-ring protein FlgI [Phycisphaerae bacterium]|nr:flagellar basal body P-ring protein FlgI [Phycisphaerae bacterium]